MVLRFHLVCIVYCLLQSSLTFSFENCLSTRTAAQKIIMTTADKTDLSQVQDVVDYLITYKRSPTVREILASESGDSFFQINHYCLFNRDIKFLLQRFIRPVVQLELTLKQKKLIQNKTLNLLRNMASGEITSDTLFVIYDSMAELADVGLLPSFSQFKNVNLDDYRDYVTEKTNALTKGLLKSKDRGLLRKQFYEQDIREAKEKFSLIADSLAKD